MKYALKEIVFILPDETKTTVKNAYVYKTIRKNPLNDGFSEESLVKVRIPKGEPLALPLGTVGVLDGREYVLTLLRENFKGINPHCYIELRG